MGKSKIKNWQSITAIVTAALLLIAVVGGFFEYVKYSMMGKEVSAYTGFKLIFGHSEKGTVFSNFHTLMFFGFILGILGTALAIFKFKKYNMVKLLVQVLFFVLASIFIFLSPNAVPFANETVEGVMSLTDTSMGIGCIITGTALLLSALTSLATLTMTMLKKI